MVHLILLSVGFFFALFFYYAAQLNRQRDLESTPHLAV